MLSKEANIKKFLFIEAEQKKERRKKIAVHDFLFSEIEDRERILEEDEILEKEAMSLQSGGSTLKNSGWNTDWTFSDPAKSIEGAKKQVAQKAAHFFASMQGQGPFSTGNTSDLRPESLAFLFHYIRTIVPFNNEEAQGKAENALSVLDQAMPGFKEFVNDIEQLQIPLNPYFMVSKFSAPEGGVDGDRLQDFVSKQQGKQLALPDGRPIPSSSHFREHAQKIASGQPIDRTDYVDKAQTMPMTDLQKASVTMLKSAIEDRIKDGYTLKVRRTGNQDQGTALEPTIIAMRDKKLVDNNIDLNNPEQRYKGAIYTHHYGKMEANILKWWEDRSVDLTAFELRLLLQHMVHQGGQPPRTPPDQFRVTTKTLYAANGWDSSSKNPGEKMLTLPPLRQLPKGEVVYDRGNGNLDYYHLVFNWQNGLGPLLQKWGKQCDEWLRTLQQSGEQILGQSSEALAAWQNVTENRTGSENIVELLKQYPTWNSFNGNHLQKSLASEIRTVNKLRKDPVNPQSFHDGNLREQISGFVNEILQIGQSDPKAAHERLKSLSSELVQLYMRGIFDWQILTLALHALNTQVASAGMRYRSEDGRQQRVSNGLTAHPASRQRTMIDAKGFELLKRSGYQVAKMMDFLSAVMYRSCHEVQNTPLGPEHKFGHQYSTSSGTSQGGDIILTVSYDKLEAQPSENQVDVFEELRFNLSQKSGANDEPIILRSALPWEQMVDIFNEMYPEAGYQFQVVEEPINRYLDMLETSIKDALVKTKGEINVIYHNSQGAEEVLSTLGVMTEQMTQREDAGETDLLPKEEDLPISQQTETAPDPESAYTYTFDQFEPEPSAQEIEEQIFPPAPDPAFADENATKQKEQMPKPMTDPMTVPMNDPNDRYIQKRDTKKRRLLRQQAGLGTIEERLQKAANKLDVCGEFTTANKIDLLLQKLYKENNVREKSRV